jgi:hypothetical protein
MSGGGDDDDDCLDWMSSSMPHYWCDAVDCCWHDEMTFQWWTTVWHYYFELGWCLLLLAQTTARWCWLPTIEWWLSLLLLLPCGLELY